MKKTWIAVLTCMLMILITFSFAQAENALIDSDKALEAFLNDCRSQKLTEFTVAMSKEYYDGLDGKYYAKLDVLMLKSGICDKKVENLYNRSFRITGVVWGSTDWAECSNLEEAEIALTNLLGKKLPSFSLICTPELFEQLTSGKIFYNLAARGGATAIQYKYSYTSHIITVEKINYMEHARAVVANEQEFLSTIDGFARENKSSFYISCLPDFFEQFIEGRAYSRMLLATSLLDQYQMQYYSLYSYLLFTDVTYSFMPRLICRNEEAIVGAIRQMGSAGIDTFNLVLTEELFNEVRKNLFARLHKLEAEAGMSSSNMEYNTTSHVLCYSKAAIAADVVKLTTITEASEYLRRKVLSGENEIVLFLSDGLYNELMAGVSYFSIGNNSMALFYDLAPHAGLFDYTFSYSPDACIVQYHVNACYPGTDIINAVREGRTGSLTGRLLDTYEAALQISRECEGGTPLETARNIHDRLCSMVVYTIDEQTDEDDTAIGAILNGKANCDGYVDAFFLIASLAGINTRYQHGDSYDVGIGMADFNNSITHMWNLIEINGTWRLVDVTWDDRDPEQNEETEIAYTWFNLGMDRATRMHIWNTETSVPLLPETDLSCRPDNEYLISSPEEGTDAIRSAFDSKQTSFEIILTDSANVVDHNELLNAIRLNAPSKFTYIWNERMLTLTVWGLCY